MNNNPSLAGSAQAATSAETVDIGRVLDAGGWSGYQKFAVALAALAIIFDGVDIQLLGIAIPAIMKEWGVARSDFAQLIAIGLIGMAIGTALAGIVGDRFGRRVALIGSVAVFGTFTLAISQADSLLTLGVLRFLAGFGLGGALPNGAALASEYVPQRYRAFAVTLTIVCVPIGGTLAGLVGAELLPQFGWRLLFTVGGLAPLVVALVLWALLPESPRFLTRHPQRWPELTRLLGRFGHHSPAKCSYVDSRESGVKKTSVREILTPEFRHDTFLVWGAFLSCLLAVYSGFNWLPSMLNGAGLDLSVASRGLAAFNLGGVVGAIGAALLITRLGSKPPMITVALIAIGGALVLMYMPITATTAEAPLITMIGITGGAINAVQTTLYALAAHVYPTAVRATGVGSASALGRGGAILSSFVGAWALERGGSHAFFFMVALAMVAALLCVIFVRRHVPRGGA